MLSENRLGEDVEIFFTEDEGDSGLPLPAHHLSTSVLEKIEKLEKNLTWTQLSGKFLSLQLGKTDTNINFWKGLIAPNVILYPRGSNRILSFCYF